MEQRNEEEKWNRRAFLEKSMGAGALLAFAEPSAAFSGLIAEALPGGLGQAAVASSSLDDNLAKLRDRLAVLTDLSTNTLPADQAADLASFLKLAEEVRQKYLASSKQLQGKKKQATSTTAKAASDISDHLLAYAREFFNLPSSVRTQAVAASALKDSRLGDLPVGIRSGATPTGIDNLILFLILVIIYLLMLLFTTI